MKIHPNDKLFRAIEKVKTNITLAVGEIDYVRNYYKEYSRKATPEISQKLQELDDLKVALNELETKLSFKR